MRNVYTLLAEKHGLGREGAKISGDQSLKYLQVHGYCVACDDEPNPKGRARASAVAKPPNTGAINNPLKVR